jgi:hypothetical protein
VNPAWNAFALANGARWRDGAWAIGSALMDAIPGILKSFYADLFARARAGAAPVDHEYECSTPTLRRWYSMRVFPCHASTFVVTHSLVRTAPVDVSEYRPEPGAALLQCSHCRRVQRPGVVPETWDFVPEYVQRVPENTSHGLCGPCMAFYYPA